MADRNWALQENGATIAEVSEEASHSSRGASNLLLPRDEALWISGDAPQYVTVQLSPLHPPLQCVGWHVWHDYLTNPKVVRLSSGETSTSLHTLLDCRALPGSGTQMWRLPHPIPAHHRFVRWTILETFGPGPTYMNRVLLFETDPGPLSRPRVNPAPHPEAATPSGVGSANPPVGSASTTTSAGRLGPATRLAAEEALRSEHRGVSRSDSAYCTPARGELYSRNSAAAATPSAIESMRSPSRMSQVLRDLDDDIKMLRPINTINPTKNMLLYMTHEPPLMIGGENTSMDSGAAPARTGAIDTGSRLDSNAENAPTILTSPPSLPLTPMPLPKQSRGSTTATANLEARLGTLEKAVAALNEAVRHQRDDLQMIKRLLLQQATERRKAAEAEFEKRMTVTSSPPPCCGAVASAPPKEHVRREFGTIFCDSTAHHRTDRTIDVTFPEEAMRGYVESLLERKLLHLSRKIESKLAGRLDHQLHDMIKLLSSTLDRADLADQVEIPTAAKAVRQRSPRHGSNNAKTPGTPSVALRQKKASSTKDMIGEKMSSPYSSTPTEAVNEWSRWRGDNSPSAYTRAPPHRYFDPT